MKRLLATAGLLILVGCSREQPERQARVELRQHGGATFELVPTGGQLPFCLVYTIAADGMMRQLTMTHENKSVPCEEGQPVGGISYRVPVEEGKVRVVTFFSDQKLNAASVGQQLYELHSANANWTPLDLRMPGQVRTAVLEFSPTAEAEATTGVVVGATGEPAAEEAGEPSAAAGADPAAPDSAEPEAAEPEAAKTEAAAAE